MISKLIFAGYTGSKNQVRTQQKIEFVSKSIFFEFEIEKKSSDTRYFKIQVEIDRGYVKEFKRRLIFFNYVFT